MFHLVPRISYVDRDSSLELVDIGTIISSTSLEACLFNAEKAVVHLRSWLAACSSRRLTKFQNRSILAGERLEKQRR